jgi:hypothetical protein
MSDQHHNNAALDAETPGLPCPPPPMPWRVPTGYFEQLPASVLERIRIENDALPPVLQSLKDTAAHRPGWPYRVPAGYFDQPQRYAATNKNEAPVITLRDRSFFKYAVAAAVLATVFGIGRWYQQTSTPDIDADPAHWVRNQVKKESTEKIESYIASSLIESTIAETDNKKEIALLTKDIAEEEILYLLSETELLATGNSESVGTQKILN